MATISTKIVSQLSNSAYLEGFEVKNNTIENNNKNVAQ